MGRGQLPLEAIGMGENPVVDLCIVAKYLAHWEAEERASTYGSYKEILKELSLATATLAATLLAAAKKLDPDLYQQLYREFRDEHTVRVTQGRLEAAAEDDST